jgi:starch synthase (maltosyl-transferring)
MPKAPQSKSKRTGTELYALVIERVTPELDGGRYPVKRIEGDLCEVSADILKDGHDLIGARIRYRRPGAAEWLFSPLVHNTDEDRWFGEIELDSIGRWEFTVEAWTDVFGTWRSELRKKFDAGQEVGSELIEGAALVEKAARRARSAPARESFKRYVSTLKDSSPAEAVAAALSRDLLSLMIDHFPLADLTTYRHTLGITVDREEAGFAAWYEMFPRSVTDSPDRHGTFADAEAALPRIAELGFDVVYLPPIHPIGMTHRKGKNNTLVAKDDDVGSPWAIGGPEGGHTAVDPRLGTVEDFERFVQRANSLGMEVALDYALQCSPDHPWVKEHPDWFFIRPDGTIKYAENPPKKYQDIYPINFWCDDREALWNACRDIFLFWMERGVRTFRVDNPHTKPFAFWEWCIEEVQRENSDVIFFAEAFTRPKRMRNLGKLGFTMSYTYFTWKNTSAELEEYLTELTQTEMAEYYRGNLFANTPDILHEYLQDGGPPAFRSRFVLASTLLPLYGIYSGYELFENVPVKPGSEEYMDSEKYQIRVRDYNAVPNMNADLALMNSIRRENRALQLYDNLQFHEADNEVFLFYSKIAPVAEDGSRNDILVVVNTDPHRAHHTMVHVPLELLDLEPDEPYVVHDLLGGGRYTWRGSANFVRLDPAVLPAHVLRIERP